MAAFFATFLTQNSCIWGGFLAENIGYFVCEIRRWTGWLGIGGAIMQWTDDDAAGRIGFAFAANAFHLVPTNERAMRLQHAVKSCAIM